MRNEFPRFGHFQVLGPTFIGLSSFAIVYKIYLTIIWKEDPYRFFEPRVKKVIGKICARCKPKSVPTTEETDPLNEALTV